MSEKEIEFKVVDKRHDRAQEESVAGEASPAEPVAGDSAEADPEAARDDSASAHGDAPTPPADFTSLVVSLASAAYLHLGEIPDPSSREPQVNLEVARHTIDMLAMLRDKTRGNLTKEEASLLNSFLYELRMKFVAKMEQL